MTPPTRALSQTEFVALMAMLAATVAFSIDAMLPAMGEIEAALTPDAPNKAQLIITSFVLGMGLGTFFTGPLSDAIGRKPVMVGGAALYIAGAALAWAAPTLEWVLAARILQGLGAAGPRVVAMAMTRDLYSGREMARIVSFIMVVFTLVPAIAPTMGAGIIALSGWRGIFASFIVFSSISVIWLMLRQPETLSSEQRRPVRIAKMRDAVIEMFANETVRRSIAVQTLSYGMLFAVLSSTQPIFSEVFGRELTFHFWFGGIAIFAGSASLLNARLVVRLGMRAIVRAAFTMQIFAAGGMVLLWLSGAPPSLLFAGYIVWTTTVFFQAGLTIGNLNALAMEPMGHIAGIAASIISALSTIGGVLIAVPIGLSYNGTPLPVAVGICLCAIIARIVTSRIERDDGRTA